MVPIAKGQVQIILSLVVGIPDICLLASSSTNARRLNSRPVFFISVVGQALVSSRAGRVLLLLNDLVCIYIGDACEQWTALSVIDLLLPVPANGAPCSPPVCAFSGHEQAQNLQQSHRQDNPEVCSCTAPERRPPGSSAHLVPAKHASAGFWVGNGIGPVFEGVQAAAVQRILNQANRLPIAVTPQVQPLVVYQAFHRLRRHHLFEEQRGKDGGEEALEGLQDGWAESMERVG